MPIHTSSSGMAQISDSFRQAARKNVDLVLQQSLNNDLLKDALSFFSLVIRKKVQFYSCKCYMIRQTELGGYNEVRHFCIFSIMLCSVFSFHRAKTFVQSYSCQSCPRINRLIYSFDPLSISLMSRKLSDSQNQNHSSYKIRITAQPEYQLKLNNE